MRRWRHVTSVSRAGTVTESEVLEHVITDALLEEAIMASAVFKLRVIPPVRRGFFCDDTSIRYPLRPETINNLTLYTRLGNLVWMHQFTSRGARPREIQASVAQSAVRSWQMSAGAGLLGLRQLSQRVHYRGLQVELRGLRPNFLAGCQPEVDLTSMENCSMHYIENVRCTNPDTALVEELRKSFVSGHATTASFNMLYLQLRLPVSSPRLAKYLFQTMALAWLIFIVASRVRDNYHHSSDIVWGCIQGSVFACVTLYKICPRFARCPLQCSHDILPTTAMTKHPVTTTSSTISKT
ncbi:hypothetical protein C0Q70_04270 [Pomacea canaliculata]|uniref:Phosphatidic acid phosphatase type 2/haloperoxidase domain-containing protein n=1 Tax=Pomacea canaliculata TaxID=400727 RepID=A0A2T7PV27_POMCA|nr:hypothetical protein C0Q70_04270 [Pomacea canaliculata]